MNEFIYQLILSNEYVSIFILMAVFATEAVMPFVGYASSMGHFSLLPAIIAGTAGSTLGSVVMYSLARLLPQESVSGFVQRYGRWIGVGRKDLDRAGRWFDHNAKATVFVGKFAPGIRTAVSLSAGFRRMPFVSFMACTILGTSISGSLLAVLGYNAKQSFDDITVIISELSVALVIAITAVIVLLFMRHRHR